MGNAGQCNYAASKAGLNGLTKSVAKELAPKNIRCNAIAPGFIATDIRSPVRPGDRVETACRIKRAKPPCYFAEGTMKVGDKVAVTAEFSFAVTGA